MSHAKKFVLRSAWPYQLPLFYWKLVTLLTDLIWVQYLGKQPILVRSPISHLTYLDVMPMFMYWRLRGRTPKSKKYVFVGYKNLSTGHKFHDPKASDVKVNRFWWDHHSRGLLGNHCVLKSLHFSVIDQYFWGTEWGVSEEGTLGLHHFFQVCTVGMENFSWTLSNAFPTHEELGKTSKLEIYRG